MGKEEEKIARIRDLGGYKVTPETMALARPPRRSSSHCLPAGPRLRGRLQRDRRSAERGVGRGGEPAARAEGAPGLASRQEGRVMSDSTHEGTNEGALWGARFATGPSPELVELSRSTQFRLDPRAVRHRRFACSLATALAAAGYLEPDEAQRNARGTGCRGAQGRRRHPAPLCRRDEDVHGALEQALIAELDPRAGRAPARPVAARNDQIATLCAHVSDRPPRE